MQQLIRTLEKKRSECSDRMCQAIWARIQEDHTLKEKHLQRVAELLGANPEFLHPWVKIYLSTLKLHGGGGFEQDLAFVTSQIYDLHSITKTPLVLNDIEHLMATLVLVNYNGIISEKNDKQNIIKVVGFEEAGLRKLREIADSYCESTLEDKKMKLRCITAAYKLYNIYSEVKDGSPFPRNSFYAKHYKMLFDNLSSNFEGWT
jgi:hypothetical protein